MCAPRSPTPWSPPTSARRRWEGSAISVVYTFANLLLGLLIIAIFVRSILTWFPIDPGSPIVVVLRDITDPILQPLRKIVPTIGMIDITPMVAIIVLIAVRQAVAQYDPHPLLFF